MARGTGAAWSTAASDVGRCWRNVTGNVCPDHQAPARVTEGLMHMMCILPVAMVKMPEVQKAVHGLQPAIWPGQSPLRWGTVRSL